MKVNEKLREQARSMPAGPGVYLFTDNRNIILYVGKAKSLRKRVVSYFTGIRSGKTEILLKKAVSIQHLVVSSESEALLLENNLIKKHQPRYNILLKDDKTFPWICVSNELFPRVFSTRTVVNDGSDYFGPYTSGLMVKTLLSLLHQLFSLRNCTLNLTIENIESRRFKTCLEFQIGNCRGPCEGLQTAEDYEVSVSQVREILNGNVRSVIEFLKQKMSDYAAELKFEEAQKIKTKLEMLSRYQARSLVVSPRTGNADVFGFSIESDFAAVNFMRVIEGAVVQTFTVGLKRQLDETGDMMLSMAMGEVIDRTGTLSSRVIVPFLPDLVHEGSKFIVPRKGDMKKLLEIAERNAVWFRLEQKKRTVGKTQVDRTAKNLECLRNDLHMSQLPKHIECFDNSNIQGVNPVASCVVFRNGKPSTSEYRHFNIRSVSGPDDYASMQEVVFRRYRRILDEDKPLPDLIIIDGGRGQLSSAMESLEKLDIASGIATIGIAKRLEEIYFPGDTVPLYIDKNSVSLKIIQHVRNEAHRFGINFHRLKRSDDMLKSEFDSIRGIGKCTAAKLLKAFKSPEAVANATREELAAVIGNSRAEIVRNYFHDHSVSRETQKA